MDDVQLFFDLQKWQIHMVQSNMSGPNNLGISIVNSSTSLSKLLNGFMNIMRLTELCLCLMELLVTPGYWFTPETQYLPGEPCEENVKVLIYSSLQSLTGWSGTPYVGKKRKAPIIVISQ